MGSGGITQGRDSLTFKRRITRLSNGGSMHSQKFHFSATQNSSPIPIQEIDLHNNNQYLRAKIAENERAQQQMNLMPGSSDYELLPPQPFEARNYLQVNGLQSDDHYSRQDQTALQLV
ncbi:unnamed protein product [Ilex paraguariensis]|uniref:Uncharacterized protein n=1 Tax=Ilex paraguariensis TaxID=185542 RepID=A0ABC8SHZ8_9AQUA